MRAVGEEPGETRQPHRADGPVRLQRFVDRAEVAVTEQAADVDVQSLRVLERARRDAAVLELVADAQQVQVTERLVVTSKDRARWEPIIVVLSWQTGMMMA